ncbi:MAG TPA: acyltransferase family protein [Rhodanobacteraceae bacterium]|nr:acyltransferase family protein [Rhodanobacteraceae bacterium]
MIRESAVNWTRDIYRPLRHAGRRVSRKLITRPTRVSRQAERYPVLDNARFVLIALVVAGHLLEQLVDTGPFAAAAYCWIYLFHMPAFVLISGALSKPTLTRRRAWAIVTRLLLPFVVFQTLYSASDAWLFHTGDWSQGYLTPYWLLWYLMSLACWRLLLPLFARLKFALPLAVAIALAAGVAPWIGYTLSLSRTLVFFPLFLLGYQIGARKLQRLGSFSSHRLAAAAILIVAVIGAWFLRDLDPEWLYDSVGYAALDAAPWSGAAERLALLSASVACALSMIALVSHHANHTGFGKHSLTAYLMHGFLVRGLVAAGVFAWLAHLLPPFAQLLACGVAGAAIATVLSTRRAARLCAPLTQPAAWVRNLLQKPYDAIRVRME